MSDDPNWFDEADTLLADMEGVEAVHEARRFAALPEEEQLLELDDIIRKAARARKRDRS